ncbi:vWA domain-containing protein [Brevibacillus panacihumi]|uniref:VWA domain-containing protein n=1 Tax=Brevibacillus panacihumi TaxID=497735 RepID=A0A3M8CN61_9BACL|nr:VWA domain-containing protein [Brevibacillus panacihumi]RNB77176.1 VWA domain-containing protein [Brevibacillus panacihumi]
MNTTKSFFIAILLATLVGLFACSAPEAEPVDTTPVEPPGQAEPQPNQNEQGENGTSAPDPDVPDREEQLQALKAMIPAELSKLPQTAEDFYNIPPGRFSGVQYGEQNEEIEKVISQIPNIKDPDQEIIEWYYLALLGLFAEDYPEPQEIINQIKLNSFGNPEVDDPRFQFKKQYNVMIVLDASGSMGHMAGKKTRMEAAKEAIRTFAESLPPEANVGLRVYGHEGSGAESAKELSCSKSDVMYPLQAYDSQKMDAALAQFKPAGWTPIALALQKAQEDLSAYKGENSTNIIYLVSDGIETCGGDPVAVAQQLGSSDITPIVNVVGFGVDGEGQRQLKQVAEAAGGRYVLIQDQKELLSEFQQASEIAQKWTKWRSGASYDALSANLSQAVSIHAYGSKWHSNSVRESYNFLSVFTDLNRLNILDQGTLSALEKIEKQQDEIIVKHGREMEAFLRDLNEKSYKEAVAAIEQTYKMRKN